MTDLVPIPPDVPVHRDDTVLPGTAERIAKGVKVNTRRSYSRVLRQFAAWCNSQGRESMPASPATFADYVAHLCDEGKAPSTIKHDMGAISKQHQLAGYPKGTPAATAANLVLNGYREERADAGFRVTEAPPITRARLRQMSAACDASTLAGKRDRLLLVIGWALAGRRSELAALRIEDVTIEDDDLMIHIRKSKTDKESVGETVVVPAGEHVDTDPIGLFNDWIGALAERGESTHTGPLFRAITARDKLQREHVVIRASDGAVLQFGRLSADAVNDLVQRAAQRACLPNAHLFSAHSLRAGFATQAANDGIPQSIWAEHGRWEKTSPVPAKYVRRADKKRDNPLRKMGL